MDKEAETKKGTDDLPQLDVDLRGGGLLGGFFKGLSGLIELADRVAREGGVIHKSGRFGIKGEKDLTGVYGFSIRTMTGPEGEARSVVRPFGDIGKVRRPPRGEERGTARPKAPTVEGAREPLTDLFDEGDHFRLVVELPGVPESDIVVEVQGDDVLQLHTTGRVKYSKEFLFPVKVRAGRLRRNYANGVLELKIEKKEDDSR